MSQLLTVASLKNSRIPAQLTVCADDPRFLQWLNSAQELLLSQGRWWGSIKGAQFCLDNGCITWPREVAVIEQVAVCGSPMPVSSMWYQYQRNLARVGHCNGCSGSSGSSSACGSAGTFNCGHFRMIEHGTAASYSTTRGQNKTIRTYISSLQDVGKTVIYQGYDKNGIWVRTQVGGVWIDGEQVTLANPFVDTTTIWNPGAPTGVLKEATVQRVLVYEHNVDTDLDRQIATYQPDETKPYYRVSYIPGFEQIRCCGCSTNDVTPRRTVNAVVSLQHVDLVNDDDWLIFTNRSAYQAAMMAVAAWEVGDAAKGNYYFYGTQAASSNARGSLRVVNRGGAIPLLSAELRKMSGDRTDTFVYLDETNRLQRDLIGFK
jgi:hypothetical protein